MQIDRRGLMGGSLALGLGLWAGTARAAIPEAGVPLMARAMASYWLGGGVMAADFLESGRLRTRVGLQFVPDDNWNFTGRLFEAFDLEEGTFASVSVVQGRCFAEPERAGMIVDATAIESADSLPHQLNWGGSVSGTLILSTEAAFPGHLILSGQLVGSRSSSQPNYLRLMNYTG